MNETTTHASPAAALQTPSWTGFVVAMAAAALMAFVGAFGTGETPLLNRVVFWFTAMISGAMIGSGMTSAIQNWGRLSSRPWLEALLISGAIAAPLNLIVIAMSVFAFGSDVPSRFGLLVSFGNVWIVSLAIVAITYALAWQRRAAERALMATLPTEIEAVGGLEQVAGARFRERLPMHLRNARLLAVASEDHYLRVYCDAGDALILLRLADAIGELAGLAGVQTHRSWWVGNDAVVRVERGAGKATLHLSNGIAAPVSRSFLTVIAAQGWQ